MITTLDGWLRGARLAGGAGVTPGTRAGLGGRRGGAPAGPAFPHSAWRAGVLPRWVPLPGQPPALGWAGRRGSVLPGRPPRAGPSGRRGWVLAAARSTPARCTSAADVGFSLRRILEGCVRIGRFRGTGGHGRGQPGPGALQPLLADRGQPLAPFPQVQRLLQGQAAALQAAHHLGELVTGLLVAECGGRAISGLLCVRPCPAGSALALTAST